MDGLREEQARGTSSSSLLSSVSSESSENDIMPLLHAGVDNAKKKRGRKMRVNVQGGQSWRALVLGWCG